MIQLRLPVYTRKSLFPLPHAYQSRKRVLFCHISKLAERGKTIKIAEPRISFIRATSAWQSNGHQRFLSSSTDKTEKNEGAEEKSKDAAPDSSAKDKEAPKGFELFQRKLEDMQNMAGFSKSNAKSSNQSGDDGSKNEKKSSNSSDKKEGGFRGMPPVGPLIAFAAMYMLIQSLFGGDSSSSGQEITWQEFYSKLLSKGLVDHLIVTNKSTCYVYLKDPIESSPRFRVGEQPGGDSHSKWDAEQESQEKSFSDPYDPNDAFDGPRSRRNQQTNRGMNVFRRTPSYYFQIGSVESFERSMQESQTQLGVPLSEYVSVQYTQTTNWLSEIMKFGPSILSLLFLVFLLRSMSGAGGAGGRGGMGDIFRVGKSNAKLFNKDSKIKTTFKDVAGCDEAKAEVLEFVEFLKNPAKFNKLGAKIPRGALLCGPPGTGKTLLAKATAGEASVPFYSISGSDFIEMFVGVGPSRVRDLFKEARKNSPCIVFIDEIDAVARKRSKGGFSGGNDERENTLNQLLVEMDGFQTEDGVVVLAGTNRMDILDEAILRPGRFDRQITVDLPDIRGRKQIFDVHLRKLNVAGHEGETQEHAKTSVAKRLAALTPGLSGAQIANICNEAAILAARQGLERVDAMCFEKSVDRVIGGLEKTNSLMSAEEKRTVAYHEAGHAIVGWFLEHADPLLKVTIIPRMNGALGFAQYLPKELRLHSQDELMDRMSMTLGGRVAEELTFGKITTGAVDDLNKVTKLAYSMVSVFGMNDKIGNLSFQDDNANQLVASKLYSEKTAQVIDEEVKAVVNEAYLRTKKLLVEKKDAVEAVAEALLTNETITQKDIERLIGPRPFAQDSTLGEYLDEAPELKPV